MGSCRRCWTSSRPSSSWRSIRRSTSATIQLARRRQAKRWHPDIAPPGRQLEHERHLKAVNEAADQLERLAEESRGGKVTRNAVKVSAAAARKRRAEEGARAYAEEQRRRAAATPTSRSHDPFGSRVPDHSVVHRYARCLSYPEWGVGQRQRDLLHRRRRRHPAVGAGVVQPGHPHGARRLAAVRRLLARRPGRRARRALHDRRQARAGRGQLRARRAAAGLRARRRAAQHRGAAPADDRVLAGGRLRRRRARGARLDPRGERPARAVPDRRAHLRGHGLALAGGRRRRARGRARAARRLGAGSGSAACGCGASTARARATRSSARARSRRREQGLLDLALVAHLAGDTGAEVSACEQATALAPDSAAAWARLAHALARTDRTSECLAACERALALRDDPEVRDLREQVLALAPRELAQRVAPPRRRARPAQPSGSSRQARGEEAPLGRVRRQRQRAPYAAAASSRRPSRRSRSARAACSRW